MASQATQFTLHSTLNMVMSNSEFIMCLLFVVRTNIIVNVALCTTIKLKLCICTIQQTNYGSHMEPLNISGEDAHQIEVYIYPQHACAATRVSYWP